MSVLIKPEPFSSEMNRFLNTFFGPEGEAAQRWVPAMDLVEGEDHYLLRADLPGMGEDDVSIEINDNVLTVSGERREEQEHQGQGWHRVERTFGRFSRSLALPEGVDADAVAASFDRGVLSIRVPKPEQRKPRRVAISVGDQTPTIEERPAVEGTASEPAVEGAASEPAVEGAASERQ